MKQIRKPFVASSTESRNIPAPSQASQGEILSAAGSNPFDLNQFIVRSEALKRVMKLVGQVARHPAAVLIAGETGTGKEMIARAIHNESLRCNNAWVDVNCAAIPEHLVESELFGYEKGAFSGADAMKPGFFELADKGTLFLDEIGDLDLKVQVKLLRVLDGVPYYRLGGSRKIGADVRVVAATNHDLQELVRQGRFRADLYYRLAQFRLEVPPLRERLEDILGIAECVLWRQHPSSRFTSDAVGALLSYSWPGNVRELKNVVFRAALQGVHPQKEITAADLCLPEDPVHSHDALPIVGGLDQVERQMIFQALERFGGNQGKAAQALGISRRTLLRKLKSYRENGTESAVATLRVEQQRYYRAQLSLPVTIQCADERFHATLLNISLGGAAVAAEKPLRSGASTSIYFSIPEIGGETELRGRVAWSSKEGHHGIQFAGLSPSIRNDLERWLQAEMNKDGWTPDLAG